MNGRIFISIYGDIDIAKAFTSISDNEDELGCILRVHLLSERLLDAWISAKINIEDLFENSANEKFKFRPSFSLKLALAKKLDFPVELIQCLQALNSKRNDFAHRYDCDPISDIDIEKMASSIRRCQAPENVIPIDEIQFQVFDKYGNPLQPYPFSSPQTPKRIKLAIIYSCVLIRVMAIVTRETFGKNTLGFKY